MVQNIGIKKCALNRSWSGIEKWRDRNVIILRQPRGVHGTSLSTVPVVDWVGFSCSATLTGSSIRNNLIVPFVCSSSLPSGILCRSNFEIAKSPPVSLEPSSAEMCSEFSATRRAQMSHYSQVLRDDRDLYQLRVWIYNEACLVRQ